MLIHAKFLFGLCDGAWDILRAEFIVWASLSSSSCQKHIHPPECTNAKRNVWYSSLEWKNLSPLQRPKIFRHFVKKIAETELNLCKTRRDKSRVLRGGRGHSRPRTSMSYDISAW